MKTYLTITFLFCLLFVSCSSSGSDDSIPEPELSSDNKILVFNLTINNELHVGTINQATKTISFDFVNADLSNPIIPTIEISEKASISPSPENAQDFSNTIQYTVSAENGEQAIYTVNTNNVILSTEKQILSFAFSFGNPTPYNVAGDIDHTELTIHVDLTADVSNIAPFITISEGATISPAINEPQDFNSPVEYTVTAEDGSSNIYTVYVQRSFIDSINSANTTLDTHRKYWVGASPYIRVSNCDVTLPNSEIILENSSNSYILNPSEIITYATYLPGSYQSLFRVSLPQDIETASDYKVKFLVDGETVAESWFEVEILSETPPQINNANQSSYNYGDTLILEGSNLLPGVRIVAHNANIYGYNQSYVTVNNEGTILTLPLTTNYLMFPGFAGQPSPHATPIVIFYNDRYGETIIVDFN